MRDIWKLPHTDRSRNRTHPWPDYWDSDWKCWLSNTFTFKNVYFFSNIFGTKRSPYSVIIFSSCPFPVNIPWQALAITSKLDDDTFPGCSDFCPPHLKATVTSPAPPGRFQTDGWRWCFWGRLSCSEIRRCISVWYYGLLAWVTVGACGFLFNAAYFTFPEKLLFSWPVEKRGFEQTFASCPF